MNWAALGAIGEMVGASAVIATLLYLTVQVRQNTRLIRRMEMNAGQEQFQAARIAIIGDRGLAEVITRGSEDPNQTG